ncbi:MAG: amidohydrolase [Pirellulales bacterium]|nr:amidohydrolase [Pirellulales bacterium]
MNAVSTSAPWQQALDAAVDGLAARLIAVRRHLHAHPEPSGFETETTRHLAAQLSTAGLTARLGPGDRGLVVDAPDAASAPRIALRGDIDALPIQEVAGREYGSRHPGLMHACGHDGHSATVLGAALALHALGQQGALPWPVPWRAIFQPAEESLTGAREMVAAGFLNGVAGIFSLHMDPSRAVGTVGVRVGTFTANCDSLRVTITGRGGHAARPHQTRDPIAALVQLVSSLYQAVPRGVDSQDPVVLSFGQIVAGDAANVIPERALLRGTLRTLDHQVRQHALEQIQRIAAAIAAATGTEIVVARDEGIESVLNDAQLTNLTRLAAVDLLGAQNVAEIPRPSMGSEDFAAYLDAVPGSMFRLGCASPTAGNSALHTPTFDLDERALAIGAKILARACILWADPRRGDER